MNSLDEKVSFCSACYATNEDGSWGTNGWSVEDVEQRGVDCYCINCAGHGEIVVLSRRAANRIRQTASWVGKRYYPHEEDLLHSLTINGDEGTYTVKWQLKKGYKTTPEGVRAHDTDAETALDILDEALYLYRKSL